MQKLRRTIHIALLLMFFVPVFATAQETAADSSSESGQALRQQRVVLASSSHEYPVTPGDMYVLHYRSSTRQIQMPIIVPPDKQVGLKLFGTVDATEMTFREFEKIVLQEVRASYTDSFPSLQIQAVGQFRVTVAGEVTEATEVIAWGLTRLSELIDDYTNRYSSTRDVQIVRNGERSTYDLFEARRNGDLSQDPYVQPGDQITVGRLARRVTLSGEVERPGTYQLLEGENLRELIGRYGNGFTEPADPSSIRIERSPRGLERDASVRIVSYLTGGTEALSLSHNDLVVVRSRNDYLPYVFVEGAVGRADQSELGQEMVTNQVRIKLREGERLVAVLQRVERQFLPVADLINAFIERDGGRVPIDVERLLYSGAPPDDNPLLQADDRIVIPFRQFFVTVSGAVSSPGQYPYIPNRTFSYYLGLAGGINPDRRIGINPLIRSVEGERRPDDVIIRPEDNIHFRTNSPIYYINYIAPALSVISTALSIFVLTQ